MPETPKPPLIYLEDLSVGDVFVSKTHALDAEQITEFASQFDPQPFHLDPEAAQDAVPGPGGQRLAHGGADHEAAG